MAIRKDRNEFGRVMTSSRQGGSVNTSIVESQIPAAGPTPASAPTQSETAHYVADMLMSLEKLANGNDLNVLSLMLAMARDQADDDAGRVSSAQARVAY